MLCWALLFFSWALPIYFINEYLLYGRGLYVDTGNMDFRLALGSIPMYFISPVPATCERIQSYPLRPGEQVIYAINVPEEGWCGHWIVLTSKFIIYTQGTTIYGKILPLGRLSSDFPVKSSNQKRFMSERNLPYMD